MKTKTKTKTKNENEKCRTCTLILENPKKIQNTKGEVQIGPLHLKQTPTSRTFACARTLKVLEKSLSSQWWWLKLGSFHHPSPLFFSSLFFSLFSFPSFLPSFFFFSFLAPFSFPCFFFFTLQLLLLFLYCLLLLAIISINKINTTGSSFPCPFLLPRNSHSCITKNNVAPFLFGELAPTIRHPKVRTFSNGSGDNFGCRHCYYICKQNLNGNFSNIFCKLTSHLDFCKIIAHFYWGPQG